MCIFSHCYRLLHIAMLHSALGIKPPSHGNHFQTHGAHGRCPGDSLPHCTPEHFKTASLSHGTRGKGWGCASAVCTVSGIWGQVTRTAQTDLESKCDGAGEAASTFLRVRVSHTCRDFCLYQTDITREGKKAACNASANRASAAASFLQGGGCIWQQGHQWLPEFVFREQSFHSSRFSLSNAKESTNVGGTDSISKPNHPWVV